MKHMKKHGKKIFLQQILQQTNCDMQQKKTAAAFKEMDDRIILTFLENLMWIINIFFFVQLGSQAIKLIKAHKSTQKHTKKHTKAHKSTQKHTKVHKT
jgi:hypothetical protein